MPLHPWGCEVERLTPVGAVALFCPSRAFIDVGWVGGDEQWPWVD